MNPKRNEYLLAVADTLGVCQLLELELKFHISQASALAEKLIAGRMVLKTIDQGDYIDAPLGVLIKMFSRFSENTELITRLKALKEDRDFVAHRGVIACHDHDFGGGEFEEMRADAIISRLDAIKKEANELIHMLYAETAKVVVALDFGSPIDGP